MTVIPVRFEQARAIRCIARDRSATVYDFCAVRAARLVDSVAIVFVLLCLAASFKWQDRKREPFKPWEKQDG